NLPEMIKESDEKEGAEGDDMNIDEKNKKNKEKVTSDNILKDEEIFLNLNDIKMIEIERYIDCKSDIVPDDALNIIDAENELEISNSIDKMVQEVLDSESDKEKFLYSLRNKKKNNSPK
ncbi:hypothetical protein ACJX0J_036433, partial [Zea mays]